MQIRKNRTKEELTNETRKKRRKKGTALGAYAEVKGTKMFSPDLDLAVIQASSQKKKVNVAVEKGDEPTVTSVSVVVLATDNMSIMTETDDENNEEKHKPPINEENQKLKVSKRIGVYFKNISYTNFAPFLHRRSCNKIKENLN